MVDQRASSTTALGYAGAGNLEIQLDGGLDLKTNPHVLESPKTTRAENALLSDQGQVKQLPGVAAVANTSKIYTAGAVPNIEPYMRGSFLSITETRSFFDSQVTTSPVPQITAADTSTTKQGPLAPVYPLTTATRSFIGDSCLNPSQTATIARYAPVSAQITKTDDFLTDISRYVLTVQLTGEFYGGNVHVSDMSGNTTSQYRRTLETSGFYTYTQYSLTANPAAGGGSFYLACSESGLGLVVYHIVLNNTMSGPDPINSITRFTVDAAGGAFKRLMLTQYQGFAVLVYANGTNLRAAVLQGASVAANINLGADFNTSAANLAAFTSTNRLFVAMGNSLRVFTSSGAGPGFTFTQQSATNIDPNALGMEAVTGVYNPANASVVVFAKYNEDYASGTMTTYGYPATAIRIVQVASVQFGYDGTTISGGFRHYFRCEQGSTIATKAFLLNNNGKGMIDSGSALVAVNLGTRFMGGGTFLGGSYILDHNCSLVARYNDNSGDLTHIANGLQNGTQTTPARGLTETYWLTEPNNASLFEVGFPFLSTVVTGSNTTVTVPASGQSAVLSYPPYVLGYNVNLCTLQYQAQGAVVTPSRSGKSMVLNGALTMEYDGRTVHESGFNFQASPPGPPTTITGNANPAGTYYYYCVYRWTDATGQMHQSAPSPARAVTYASSWDSVGFIVFPPSFTYKGLDSLTFLQTSAAPVSCDLYRSSTASADPTGAVAYLINSVQFANTQHLAEQTLNFGNFIKGASDTQNSTSIKTSSPPLYTQSQIAAQAPPSFIYTINSKGRCFGLAQVGATYRVYFSSPYSDTPFPFASRWNVNGFVTVPPELGDCRSLAALDDKILIFGTAGVAAFNGDGPSIFDKTGSFNYTDNPTQLNYSAVTPLPMPLGTVGCGAPVTIPNGVLYQDRQGIMLIDRGLGATFVGGAVDALTNVNRYGRPYLHPALNSVVYPNARGSALVYSFDLQRFSEWPALQNSVGMFQTINGTTFSINTPIVSGTVASSSKMLVVRNLDFADSIQVALPTLTLETPWEHIGQGFGGEGSIWEALVTGLYYAPHTLTLEMAYDYGPYEAAQSVSYLTGATTPQVPYQSKFRPPRRARADVIRFRVTVTPESGSKALECARLTGITLYAGAYRGAQRVGSGVQR